MGYTGIVRKTDTDSINRRLDDGAIVLISPLGHSYGGKTFNLSMSEAAEAVAVALQAEKLVYLTEEAGICNADGVLMSTLSSGEVRHLIETVNNVPVRLLQAAVNAVENGVSRVQILSGREDGGLLRELFTREGCGTAIARDAFVSIRQAHSRDIPRIIALIRPLEEQGILLHRSREYLENHISGFSVLEHDRNIYGCVALKNFDDPEIGELACLVVSPEARDGGYGEMLLDHLFQKARAMGIRRLFALSTHTGEWFAERGFQTTSPDALPEERRHDYLANATAIRKCSSEILNLDATRFAPPVHPTSRSNPSFRFSLFTVKYYIWTEADSLPIPDKPTQPIAVSGRVEGVESQESKQYPHTVFLKRSSENTAYIFTEQRPYREIRTC